MVCVVAAAGGRGCRRSPDTEKPEMPVTTGTIHGVRWLDWGPEIFDQARREDKLILLDSGATWCHWCHVMDRVTYEDAEVIALLNRNFIPVRIDRDRMPDVDAHYQRAVPIIRSGGNGWPLTVVITPDGHMLFKATFVPPRPDGRYGPAPGLIDMLEQLDRYWRRNKRELSAAGEQARHLTREQAGGQGGAGTISTEQVAAVVAGVKDTYDAGHGGFGGAPKFFAAPAIELLLGRAWAGDAQARKIAVHTLESMMRGGIYDQIGGGFHRYSVDERWHVPHFEKMAYDNAALLACYSNAHALTGREDFARVVRGTLTWISRVLTAPDGRGFYASQDADVGLSDDGDYFTWTAREVREVLGDDAKDVISFYGIDAKGDMHGRAGRNVLHMPMTPDQRAARTGTDESDQAGVIEKARSRLLLARQKRTAPAVDKTVFADLNGMLIDAHLTAYERLGQAGPRDRAMAILDRLLEDLRDQRGVFGHYRQDHKLHGVGMLADQAWMLRALVHAYAVTGKPQYLRAAGKLGDFITSELVADDGALLSAARPAATHPAAVTPSRRWEDTASRSAASVAAQSLVDLGYLSGRSKYSEAGAKSLESFAGGIERRMGTFVGGWALAAAHYLEGPRTITVVGPTGGAAGRTLASAARKAYVPGGMVIVLDPGAAADADLLKRLGYPARRAAAAYVCYRKTCLKPAETVAELGQRIAELATR